MKTLICESKKKTFPCFEGFVKGLEICESQEKYFSRISDGLRAFFDYGCGLTLEDYQLLHDTKNDECLGSKFREFHDCRDDLSIKYAKNGDYQFEALLTLLTEENCADLLTFVECLKVYQDCENYKAMQLVEGYFQAVIGTTPCKK